MKPKTMILMVVAVGCGLAASYMTSKLLADRKQVKEEEKVRVLYAKTKVPRYTIIKDAEQFFEPREVPKSAAPRSYFTDVNEVKGKRVNKEIKADVHISEEDVSKATSPLPIPDGGFVAAGMTVTAAGTAGFFVYPGDKVDVMLTQKGPNPSCQTILRDVLVLAVGDKTHRGPEGEAPSGALQANTATVALTPDDAQLLSLASTQGELSLLLRKEGDTSKGTARVVTLRDLKRAGFNVASDTTPPGRNPGNDSGRDFELPPIKTEPPKEAPKTSPVKEAPKTDVTEEPVEEPLKKEWTMTIEAWPAGPKRVHFYRRPDGSITKDEADPELKEGKEGKGKETKKKAADKSAVQK